MYDHTHKSEIHTVENNSHVTHAENTVFADFYSDIHPQTTVSDVTYVYKSYYKSQHM